MVNEANDVSGGSDQSEETAEEIKDFINSLNSIQRGLWLKLRNKAVKIITKFTASHGAQYPAIELHRRLVCGGGCILSSQCSNWDNGNRNCRCSWFTCGLI